MESLIQAILVPEVDYSQYSFEGVFGFFYNEDHYHMFKYFIDSIQKHVFAIFFHLTTIASKLLYTFQVGPIKAYNTDRKEFCQSLPNYGSQDFLMILEEHPLAILLCTNWFGERLKHIERLLLAPYILIRGVTDGLYRLINGEQIETPIMVVIPVESVPIATPISIETVEQVEVVLPETTEPEMIETTEVKQVATF